MLYPGKVETHRELPASKSKTKLSVVGSSRKDKTDPRMQKALNVSKVCSEKVRKLESSVDASLKNANLLGTLSMISLPSVITGEFRLESGSTYHASTNVYVSAGATLIHEPGAVVKWAENTGLDVDPNGFYISNGLPGAMCIHTADIDNASAGYWRGIKLQGGNAYVSMSKITYTYVAYSQKAISLHDITLNGALENNFVEYNIKGIVVYGPRQTKISNNVAYWNDYGIDASPENESGTTADPKSAIEIVSNTCHENDYGIRIAGTSEALLGTTLMERNISSASTYYNYILRSGNLGSWFSPLFIDNGRWLKYAGSANTNYDEASWEYNPVHAYSNPFVQGPGYFDIVRLDQTCAFVNAASVYALESSQVGFTTSIDDTPDVNLCDLGYHYANWSYSSTVPVGDLNGDSNVDVKDLAILAEYWLFDYNDARQIKLSDYDDSGTVDFRDLLEIVEYWLNPYNFEDFAQFAAQWKKEVDPRLFNTGPDLNKDDMVNFKDFTILASQWRKTGASYPPIVASFSDGQCGGTMVSVSGYDSGIYRLFLFVDGYYVTELFVDMGNAYSNTEIFAPWLEAGNHEAKIIAFTIQEEVVCYPIQQMTVAEGITNCNVGQSFKRGSRIPFSVSSPLSNVKVSAIYNGGEVWSSTFASGSYITGEVPSSITQNYDLECLQFTPVVSGGKAMTMFSSSGGVTAPTASAEDDFSGYTALIICPYSTIYFSTGLTERIATDLERNGFTVKVMTFNAWHWRIKRYAQKEYIKVLCYIGHGGYDIGAILKLGTSYFRSTVMLDGGYCISDKVSNYPEGSAPSWLQPLPPAIESSINTWKEMDFQNLSFVTFDCCYDGLLKIDGSNQLVKNDTLNYDWMSDMTEAFNLYYEDNFFFSWAHYWNSGVTSEYHKFSCNMWRTFGDGYSLGYAIDYAVDEAEEEPGDGGDPREEFRLYGQGWLYYFFLHEIY
jgi:hypothetical protein